MELTVMQGANLALRFLLELAVLASVALWGFQLQGPTLVRVIAGLGAPLVVAVVWGVFAAPRAAVPLSPGATLAVQLVVLTVGVVALAQAGRPVLAVALAVLSVGNGALMAWWGP